MLRLSGRWHDDYDGSEAGACGVLVSVLAMVSGEVVAGVQADSMAEPAINKAI
jgi:hypothetical protein